MRDKNSKDIEIKSQTISEQTVKPRIFAGVSGGF